MMADMFTFSRDFLNAIAYVLGPEPVIYLSGLFCLCVIVKVFKLIITSVPCPEDDLGNNEVISDLPLDETVLENTESDSVLELGVSFYDG